MVQYIPLVEQWCSGGGFTKWLSPKGKCSETNTCKTIKTKQI